MVRRCTLRNECCESVRFHLLLARIQQQTSSGVSSLPYVLVCLSLCSSLHLDTLWAEASLLLARIHIECGSAQLALAIARNALPRLLEHADRRTQIDAHIVVAECLIALAQTRGSSGDGSDGLLEAIGFLRRALELSAGVRSLQRTAFYYLAFACHHVGDIAQRDEFAARFVEIAS